MLEILPTKFSEVRLVRPFVYADARGYFKETYREPRYAELGIAGPFVQDNVSLSRKGVLRGMHYDLRMAKLVQCLAGCVYDVFVDMREGSPTYRCWDGAELTGENHRQIYIPAGFAHGFYTRSDEAIVMYKQTALYDPAYERAVSWRDPQIAIDWQLDGDPVLSAKDAAL